MKLRPRVELPQWLLIAAMFISSAILWPYAPDRIPMHWNASGDVDRYGGKFEGLFLLPLVTVGLYLLLLFLPRIDPGKVNYQQFWTPYTLIRTATIIFMAGIHVFVLLWTWEVELDVARLMFGLTGLLFLVIGNVMGKLRPNWFAGVRTPWTLSSKRSWVKTHRLAGWLFALAGLIFLVLALIGNMVLSVPLLFGTIGLVAIVPVVYSYFVWRNDPERVPPSGTLPGESND